MLLPLLYFEATEAVLLYLVSRVALKVETSRWLSSGKLVAPKEDNIQDIKSVYNIVLFESSPEEFHEFPNVYIHRSEQKCDTGIKIELLQKYVFIPIDIFKKTQHNKNITGKLNACLCFSVRRSRKRS